MSTTLREPGKPDETEPLIADVEATLTPLARIRRHPWKAGSLIVPAQKTTNS